jgi:PAS domain S-box-containing protein
MRRKPKKKAVTPSSYQASEELYQALFEHAADGILIADAQGRYVEVNQRGCEMLGYTREEMLDLFMKDLIPAEELVRDPLQTYELRAGKTIFKELRLRCKDGRLLPVEISIQMLADGNYLGMVKDISKRMREEESLRANEERLQLALDAAQMGQWDWNIVTGEVVWSQQCLALYGLPPNTSMSYDRFMQALHPEDRERVDAALRRAVEERSNYDEQKRTIWPDGSIHWTASRGRVYCDAKGQPIRLTGVTFDITKWKKTEEALRSALTELTVIQQNAPIMMMLVDHDRRVRKVNETALLYTGRPEEEMLGLRGGEALRCLHHLDDPQGCGFGPACATCAVRLAVLDTFATHESKRDVETWMVFPRGESIDERCLLISTAYLQMDNAMRVLICAQDITDYKRAEEAVRESEERYRLIAENTADTISIFDLTLKPIYVSPSVLKLRGYTVQEAMTQSLDQVLTPESLQKAKKVLAEQLALEASGKADPARTVLLELEEYRKDGSTIWIELSVSSLRDNNSQPTGILTVSRDITERKQAQEALTLFRSLIDHANDIIEVVDPETGRFLDANERACLAHGYTREEYLALTVPQVNAVVTTRTWKKTVEELRRSGSLIRESKHRRKDGSIFPVEININYIRLDRDYILSVVRDITERKRLEEENEQLTAQFYQAQKMESIGRLAGGIAHDFNNLLVPLIGYVELNLMNSAPDSQLYTDLTQIRRAADRAAKLTRQILAFSRQQVLELRLLDLNVIIDEFKKMLHRLIGENIELQTVLSPSLHPVRADKGQIEQILIQYSHQSGGGAFS